MWDSDDDTSPASPGLQRSLERTRPAFLKGKDRHSIPGLRRDRHLNRLTFVSQENEVQTIISASDKSENKAAVQSKQNRNLVGAVTQVPTASYFRKVSLSLRFRTMFTKVGFSSSL